MHVLDYLFQDRLSLNAGQKYCMLQMVPVVIMAFVLSIFEWLFYTGFTVHVFQFRQNESTITIKEKRERSGSVVECFT